MNDLQDNQGQGVLYVSGTRGYSAYEIAVQNGFVGTEQEWLDSLVGPQGEPGTPFDELTEEQKEEIRGEEGKSAYEIAVENGFIGTEQDWVNSFLTPDGYYNKEETETQIENNLVENVTYLFNSQKNVNDTYYFKTEDEIPVYDKKYFVKTNDDFYNNGYLQMDHLSVFSDDYEYYERSESYTNIAGECSIIKAFGKTIMLDTGGTNRRYSIKKYLEDNNVSKIDYLILSHYHYDHCTNLANMVDYLDFSECKCYFPNFAPIKMGEQSQTTISNFINTTGVEVIYPNELDSINIGELKITFYNCGQQAFSEIQELYGEEEQKVNDYCMVVLFNYRNTNVLYSGDIERIAQTRLYNKGFFINRKIDLYKYHHHAANSINNCYQPFLKTLAPKEIVILSSDINMAWLDRRLFNLTNLDFVYYDDVEYISNGLFITSKKRKTEDIKLKNTRLFTNAFPLNNYFEILKFTFANFYTTINVTFNISDIQQTMFTSVFRLKFHVGNNPLTISKKAIHIENISSTGTQRIISNIYVGIENNTLHLYLKKTQNYITPVISMLQCDYEPEYIKLELGHDNLTEDEFTSKYGDNYVKGSFANELTFSEYFANYNSNDTNPLRWYKTGNLVEITGVIKNLVKINAAQDTLICELPDEIQPSGGDRLFIQQSNLSKQWCAHLVKDSTLNKYVLKFTRYGSDGSLIDCEIGAFLCVSLMYTTAQ